MKIAVLISGGVDSAVVVHKLYSEGHELHLFYIRIGMDNGEGDCSADEDIEVKGNNPPRFCPGLPEARKNKFLRTLLANSPAAANRGDMPHPTHSHEEYDIPL